MKKHPHIAFLHGLESVPVSKKSEWLHRNYEHVYTPPMNYAKDGLFEDVLEQVIIRKIELLIGSSMGGWFAYCLSSHTGIPTILFNPALHSRSIEPKVNFGESVAFHKVILGRNDEIIPPQMTLDWINRHGPEQFSVFWEENTHRTPLDIFTKYIVENY